MRVDQAQEYCDNLNSHLLEIYTEEQLNITRTMLMEGMEKEMGDMDWYLGGNDLDTAGTFMWQKAEKTVGDWIWPPGQKIGHNWGCVSQGHKVKHIYLTIRCQKRQMKVSSVLCFSELYYLEYILTF